MAIEEIYPGAGVWVDTSIDLGGGQHPMVAYDPSKDTLPDGSDIGSTADLPDTYDEYLQQQQAQQAAVSALKALIAQAKASGKSAAAVDALVALLTPAGGIKTMADVQKVADGLRSIPAVATLPVTKPPAAGTGTVTGTGGTGDLQGPINPFSDQGPETAFTRYLALQGNGLPSYGTQGRSSIERRGAYLSDIAPAFGYGVGADLGGQGMDFAPFYSKVMGGTGGFRQDSGVPFGQGPGLSFGNVGEAARQISSALGSTNEDDLANALAYQKELAAANGDPSQVVASKPTYSAALAGGFADQDRQGKLVRSNLMLNVNPWFQQGLSNLIGRKFNTQQAMDPNTQFLDFAIKAGLI